MPTSATWEDDQLNRKEFAGHVRQLLESRYAARKDHGAGSFILNLDSAWGEGKTYFLSNLAADLEAREHPVAFVNAWEDDRSDDPLTSVISAIEEALESRNPKAKTKKLLNEAKSVIAPVALEAGKQIGKHALKKSLALR